MRAWLGGFGHRAEEFLLDSPSDGELLKAFLKN